MASLGKTLFLLSIMQLCVLLSCNGPVNGLPVMKRSFGEDFPFGPEDDTAPTAAPESDKPTTDSAAPTTDGDAEALDEFKGIHDNSTEPTNQPSVGAFHLGLKQNAVIEPASAITLDHFESVYPRKGLFISDTISGFNPVNGTFSPLNGGVYLLSAVVHLSNTDSDVSPTVTVEICLNEDCTLSGLKATAGFQTSEHTVSVVGALMLEESHRVTVRVKSGSTSQLTVLKDSTFMGFPLSQPAENL